MKVTGPGRFQEGNVSPNLDRYRTRFRHVFEMPRCAGFSLQHGAHLNSAGKRKGGASKQSHLDDYALWILHAPSKQAVLCTRLMNNPNAHFAS